MIPLVIPAPATGPALTPTQKRFNTLLRQIDTARQALADWRTGIDGFRRSHAEVLQPLQAELLAGHRAWVLALDAVIELEGWGHAERRALAAEIVRAAGETLAHRADDAEMRALFDRYSAVDFEATRRERVAAMKHMVEAMSGLDLGDAAGFDSTDDVVRRMRQGLDERAAAEEAAREARPARKNASAARQRREAEAAAATQSVREVFRKLASALHPDRETDAVQRERKTALMQRANQAYAAGDLLALLELHLEVEQIDASHVAHASEQRLKHFNKVLAGQLAELKDEREEVEASFRHEFGLHPSRTLDPRHLAPLLQDMARQWQADLHAQRRELRMLDDPAATKRWLKRLRPGRAGDR